MLRCFMTAITSIYYLTAYSMFKKDKFKIREKYLIIITTKYNPQ